MQIFRAGLAGDSLRPPSSLALGTKNRSWGLGIAGSPEERSAELGLPYIAQAYCSITFWGKYQITIFKGSGGFNYGYDKTTFRFK